MQGNMTLITLITLIILITLISLIALLTKPSTGYKHMQMLVKTIKNTARDRYENTETQEQKDARG